jgi:predicted glutamine amidotransferase
MCRYAAYLGPPLLLSELVYQPPNSLVHQSMDAMRSLTRINADGFGVGWYAPETSDEPAVFKDTSPMWNNYNLGSLAGKIRSGAVVAHVRAAKRFDPVTRENCHPFQRGRLLWMHNGDIPGRARLTRRVALRADDTLLAQIRGNTDTEMAFTLFLTHLGAPPLGELTAARLAAAMEATVSELAGWHLDDEDERPLELNFCVCTGKELVATRFALSDKEGPTLHCRAGESDAGDRFVVVASEPLSRDNGWKPVENGEMLTVDANLELARHALDSQAFG